MQRRLVDENDVGPVVSRFQLAALLWLGGGSSEKAEIASAQLLSAASAFLSRDRGLISKVKAYAAGVEAERQELVEAFVQTPLSYEFLQDATLGGVTQVDDDAVAKVVDRLVERGRVEGAVAERKRSEKSTEQHWLSAQAAEGRAAEIQRRLKQAEAQAADAERAREAAKSEVRSREELAAREIERSQKAAARLRDMLSTRETSWQRAHRAAVSAVSILRWVTIIVLCYFAGTVAETSAVAGAGFFASLSLLLMLIATRLSDRGRELQRQIADQLAMVLLERSRTELNNELGVDAPPIELEIANERLVIRNKEAIVTALMG